MCDVSVIFLQTCTRMFSLFSRKIESGDEMFYFPK